MPTSFQFERLRPPRNEVRLIKLLPGVQTEPIRCDSYVISLDDDPRYQALSYAWGNQRATDPIQLCGERFSVSTNLLSALKSLRLQDEARVLWIDAVCIDQENDKEKAWQVNLMRKIFSKCQEGLLWIGDESEQSDAWCTTNDKEPCTQSDERGCGRDFDKASCSNGLVYNNNLWKSPGDLQAEHLHCRWHGHRPRISTLLELISMLGEDRHLNDIPPLSETFHQKVPTIDCLEPLMALRAFMNRSWWTRMWTVQEAVLPPVSTLCWGTFRYPLRNMIIAANRLYTHSKTCCSGFFTGLVHKLKDLSCGEATVNALFNFQRHLHTLGLTQSWINEPGFDVNLMDYLYNFHERRSKDPKDKIYALLGLLPERFRIPADYQTTAQALYEKVSLTLLSTYPDRSLSVLWRESQPKPIASIPSWVKDFDNETRAFNRRARGELYDASNGKRLQMQECGNGMLSFLGIQVDIVSELAPNSHVPSTYALGEFSTFRDWAQFLRLNDRCEAPYIGGGTLFEAFTRTLTGDVREIDPSYPAFGEEEAEAFAQSLLEENVEDGLINSPLAQELNTSAAGRKLFITQNGLIGLGPDWMQRGDEVWVLIGCSVPIILRPMKNAGSNKGCEEKEIPSKYHIVIGDSYVHGIMFGEAVGVPGTEQQVLLR